MSLGLLIQLIEPRIGVNIISHKIRRALLFVKNTMILISLTIIIAVILHANVRSLSD
jgi:hypothetical protein